MTRLASFCSGVLEVVNAVAVRLEDVVGEWVDGLAPRPATRDTYAAVAEAMRALEFYIEARVEGFSPDPYRDALRRALTKLAGGRS